MPADRADAGALSLAGPDPLAPCARLSCVDGAIVAANAPAAALLGLDAGALVGRHFTRCLAPGSALLWDAQFLPLLMARGAVDGSFLTLRRDDGEELPVLVAAAARHEHGALHVELALLPARQRVAFERALREARDEAERARVELAELLARQRATEAQLRQAQKMEGIGQLAGGIAHDFNNLLAVMSGHLELAAQTLGDVPAARELGVLDDLACVREAADRAAGVVRQLLAFSREQVLVPGRVDLNACVRRAERLLPRLLGRDVTWRSVLRTELWPVTADEGQLEQLLLNVALNARDAIRATGCAGELCVSTTHVEDADGAAWVRLTVRDTGIGMDGATQARAFEPFFTTRPPGEGSGLGLAMVYGIVRQSGGRVRLESAPGAGTSVVVDLPRARAAELAPASSAAPSAACTLLLVDDEAAVRAMTRRMLERAGFAVLEAEHGAAGLERWAAHRGEIGAVVSDVRMPVLDGHALGARLRGECPALPLLLVSGYAEREVAARGPCDGFLEKPFTAQALVAALARLGVRPDA